MFFAMAYSCLRDTSDSTASFKPGLFHTMGSVMDEACLLIAIVDVFLTSCGTDDTGFGKVEGKSEMILKNNEYLKPK